MFTDFISIPIWLIEPGAIKDMAKSHPDVPEEERILLCKAFVTGFKLNGWCASNCVVMAVNKW